MRLLIRTESLKDLEILAGVEDRTKWWLDHKQMSHEDAIAELRNLAAGRTAALLGLKRSQVTEAA